MRTSWIARCSVHLTRWLAFLCALLGASLPAHAEQRRVVVVLLESSNAEGRLRDALRIQLPREAALETEPLAPSATISAHIHQARERLTRRGGLLALWVAQDAVVGDEREVTVYFVGRRGDRALVEVVRVRAGAGEMIERAVALKATEVLEALRSTPDADLIVPFAGSAAEPTPDASPRRDTSRRVSLVAELGAGGATPAAAASAQVSAHVAAGAALRMPEWRFEVLGVARAPTAFERTEAAGTLHAIELDLLLSMRALFATGDFALGGFGSVGARLMNVEGRTVLGTHGSSERAVPILAFGPEARLSIRPWLAVRLAGGAELALRRQSFTLNGEPVIDLGRGRGFLEVGVTATLP